MTVLESEIALQERKVEAALQDLRSKKFEKSLPFLILSDDLPEGQAYREFADGRMEVQEVYEDGPTLKAKVVRVVANSEAARVKLKHGLR